MGSFTKKAILAAPAFALILIFGTDTGNDYLRRLTTNCIKTIYANTTTILLIPEVPANTNNNIPAYIALCQDLLNQEIGAYIVNSAPNNTLPSRPGTFGVGQVNITVKEIIHVQEQLATCKDWSSPHASIMDIISALVVTRFTPSVRYRHNCASTRVFDEDTIGFDHTTVQQVISNAVLAVQDVVSNSTAVYQQCRRCLMYFNPTVESARVGSKAHHHCFAWPNLATKNTNVSKIPNLPGGAYFSPLSMVIQPLLQRYYQAALQFSNVTSIPPQETQSGVVIFIDQNSLGLNYSTYMKYIPAGATSITILAGPLCAKAYLSIGQLCSTYGQNLAASLLLQFPKLTKTGFNSGPGVSFQIAASTAGISSRLTLAQLTICAPHTTSCYLPTLARQTGSSIVLEDPTWNKAIDFFTYTGYQGKNVSVVVLASNSIPSAVNVTLPKDPSLATASQKFTLVNVVVNDEGYPSTVQVPAIPTDAVIQTTTDPGIITQVNAEIGTFASNSDVESIILELIPSTTQVTAALEGKYPLTVNVFIPNGWGAQGLTGELGIDSCLGLKKATADVQYMNQMNGFRTASITRIQSAFKAEARSARRIRNGVDPTQIFEVSCPTNAVVTSSGYALPNTRRMVAVDHHTFKFGAGLHRICAEANGNN
jgi:hypothetical protein